MPKWSELRTRKQVRRDGGSIQLADDDGRSGSGCFVCRSELNVRFVQFNSPTFGDRVFLRICDICLDVVHTENLALKEPRDGGG